MVTPPRSASTRVVPSMLSPGGSGFGCETWTVLSSGIQSVIAGWFAILAKTVSGDPPNRITPSVWSGAAV
jgi:hypothetical protein